MKKPMLKFFCFILAATVLLTGCNTKPPANTTVDSTSSSSTSDSTSDSTSNSTSEDTTSATESYLPVVDPEKYNEAQISEDVLQGKVGAQAAKNDIW